MYVIEAIRHRVELDPSINVFQVVVRGDQAQWPESFGSTEALNAFLKGLEVMLNFEGYAPGSLQWDMPLRTDLAGLRWTLTSKGAIIKREEIYGVTF